jgi:hypothetical protein
MSLKALAQQTLARLAGEMEHETRNETEMKQVKQTPVSCFTDPHACFTPMKHGDPQKTAISEPCFTVSFPRDETHETNLVASWREHLANLDPDTPPPPISCDRWRRLLLDADCFLTDWGNQAAALGWSTIDLFGCSPHFARRLDRDGLVTGLEGRVVTMMTDSHAMIDAGDRKLWRHERRDRSGAVTWWATQ